MNLEEILKVIDDDIEKHHQKASDMFGVVTSVLGLGIIILFIYFAPAMVTKVLPNLEAVGNQKYLAYKAATKKFETEYNKEFYVVTKSEYEKYKDKGNLSAEIKSARQISKLDDGKSILIDIFHFISKLKVEDKKIEFVLKILPYVIGVILAGFLVTYRLHITAAKELAIKKIDILSSHHVDIADNS